MADHETDVVVPTHEDPFVRATSGALGGPVGRHARLGDRRWWLPIRLLVLFAVIGSTLSWVEKSSCATHGYAHEYQYTRLCYTDVLALWYGEHLDEGRIPIIQNETPTPNAAGVVSHKYVEYPVGIGALMAAAMFPVRAFVPSGPSPTQQAAIDKAARDKALGYDKGTTAQSDQYAIDQYLADRATAQYQSRQARYFFDLTSLYLVICAVFVVVLTGLAAGRRRIWDAAMVGLCPVMVLNGMVNWDLAAVALTAGAVVAWARRRTGLAGVLLGLGVATKFYPVFLLVPYLALSLRAGRLRSWLRLLTAGVVTWLVVDVPFMIINPAGFWRFYTFNKERGTEYNSLFYSWEYFVRHQQPLSTGVLNGVSDFLLLMALAAIFVLILLVRRRPRVGQVLFLTAFAFVITNKVYSPQYALWLLPFVVLARPRWRYFLVWQMSEIVLFVTLYSHLVFVDKSGTKGIGYAWFFGLGLLPRDLILAGLAGLVIYEMVHPDADVVRAGGDDDPAGGVLDGAPDALFLPSAADAVAEDEPWGTEVLTPRLAAGP
ncbi:MAG TPA: glycosyltransferase 87 family protein [Mycobacteriales bacterium]